MLILYGRAVVRQGGSGRERAALVRGDVGSDVVRGPSTRLRAGVGCGVRLGPDRSQRQVREFATEDDVATKAEAQVERRKKPRYMNGS